MQGQERYHGIDGKAALYTSPGPGVYSQSETPYHHLSCNAHTAAAAEGLREDPFNAAEKGKKSIRIVGYAFFCAMGNPEVSLR